MNALESRELHKAEVDFYEKRTHQYLAIRRLESDSKERDAKGIYLAADRETLNLETLDAAHRASLLPAPVRSLSGGRAKTRQGG